jgi:hypothetical protein
MSPGSMACWLSGQIQCPRAACRIRDYPVLTSSGEDKKIANPKLAADQQKAVARGSQTVT